MTELTSEEHRIAILEATNLKQEMLLLEQRHKIQDLEAEIIRLKCAHSDSVDKVQKYYDAKLLEVMGGLCPEPIKE